MDGSLIRLLSHFSTQRDGVLDPVFSRHFCCARRSEMTFPSSCYHSITSLATSGEGRNDRNTNGQRGNKVNSSYRDISVVVAENNGVVKPKCQQETSLN